MTAYIVPVIIDALAVPASVKFEDDTRPRVRIDLVGGTEQIPGHHDSVLATFFAIADTNHDAWQIASDARTAIRGLRGPHDGMVITKVTTTPPRFDDAPDYTPTPGVASFTARIWVHRT